MAASGSSSPVPQVLSGPPQARAIVSASLVRLLASAAVVRASGHDPVNWPRTSAFSHDCDAVRTVCANVADAFAIARSHLSGSAAAIVTHDDTRASATTRPTRWRMLGAALRRTAPVARPASLP